jgi:hypothetical protein
MASHINPDINPAPFVASPVALSGLSFVDQRSTLDNLLDPPLVVTSSCSSASSDTVFETLSRTQCGADSETAGIFVDSTDYNQSSAPRQKHEAALLIPIFLRAVNDNHYSFGFFCGVESSSFFKTPCPANSDRSQLHAAPNKARQVPVGPIRTMART